jgi:hypothetical protein
MFELEVFSNPGHKVILEPALDDLMEKVRGKQLADIGSRKVIRKGLEREVRLWYPFSQMAISLQ